MSTVTFLKKVDIVLHVVRNKTVHVTRDRLPSTLPKAQDVCRSDRLSGTSLPILMISCPVIVLFDRNTGQVSQSWTETTYTVMKSIMKNDCTIFVANQLELPPCVVCIFYCAK